MKNLTNMMIAAAALVVTAGMAKAQVIKAEVPFAFHVGGKLMPAGEYSVNSQSGASGQVFNLVNADAHSSVYAMPYQINSSRGGDAKLIFECSGANCALFKMSAGTGPTYGFSHPKWSKGEDTRVTVIRAILVK